MTAFDVLVIVLIGIIEGITEWLPVSSTGHMLIFDEFVTLNASADFKEFFFVVIQLGAILAVVTVFLKRMIPIGIASIEPVNGENANSTKKLYFKRDVLLLWIKVAVACLPSAVIGLLFDDLLSEYFGSPYVVALMLVVYGIAFIIVEKMLVHRTRKCDSLENITFMQAFLIGAFQVLSLIPGTSRSGATIIGALIIGVGRTVGAEFTFFLAVPTMLGASALKLFKYGFALSGAEIASILIGATVAYLVSLAAIKFLMDFVKKHSFTVFGCYRIALGALVLLITLI